MSEQTPAPPPMPVIKTNPNDKWRWLKITIGIVAAGFLVIRLLGSSNSLPLELTRKSIIDRVQDGKIVEVVNVGSKPITITNVNINDRNDCAVFSPTEQFQAITLKIGDVKLFVSACRIVRVTVQTTDGSATYSFSGNQ